MLDGDDFDFAEGLAGGGEADENVAVAAALHIDGEDGPAAGGDGQPFGAGEAAQGGGVLFGQVEGSGRGGGAPGGG